MSSKAPGEPSPPGGGMDPLSSSKGLLQALSEGIRNLLVLDEKLVLLGKEGDRVRSDVRTLQEVVFKLLGKAEEMDKRLGERFGELDKRLAEMDKRIEVQVELAVRKKLDSDRAGSGQACPD